MNLLYHTLFEECPVALAVESAAGRFIEVNASFCAALRGARDDVLAMDPATLIPGPPQRLAGGPSPAGGAAWARPMGRLQMLRRMDGSISRFMVIQRTSADEGDAPLTLWAMTELPESSTLRPAADGVVALNLQELLDCLPMPVLVLDIDRRIVQVNLRTELDLLIPIGRAGPGTPLTALGDGGWHQLDAELAKRRGATGLRMLAIELPRADGSRQPMEIEVTELSAVDATTRLVLVVREAVHPSTARQRRLDEQAMQARSDAYNRASSGLVGLAALMQLNAGRRRRSEGTMRNLSSRVMALSTVFAWQARSPDRLPVVSLARSVVANQARANGLEIPFDRPVGDEYLPARAQAFLHEKDASVLVFAMDELVANAIAHCAADGGVVTRLRLRPDGGVFEVRNTGRLDSGKKRVSSTDEPGGLGLFGTLIPDGARLSLAQEGGDVVASLVMSTPLLRFE